MEWSAVCYSHPLGPTYIHCPHSVLSPHLAIILYCTSGQTVAWRQWTGDKTNKLQSIVASVNECSSQVTTYHSYLKGGRKSPKKPCVTEPSFPLQRFGLFTTHLCYLPLARVIAWFPLLWSYKLRFCVKHWVCTVLQGKRANFLKCTLNCSNVPSYSLTDHKSILAKFN